VWAATGPAMEAYSQYPVVKKANQPGEVMTVSEFLNHVRRMVVDFVVGRVLSSAGVEEVSGLDSVTTYYLLHRHDFKMEDAPAGPCILYAVSCGLSDKDLADRYNLLARRGGKEQEEPDDDEEGAESEGTGSSFRLKAWNQRTHPNMGYDPQADSSTEKLPLFPDMEREARPTREIPLIDQIHRLMHLWKSGDVSRVNEYLDLRGLRRNTLFHQLLQALIELSANEERSLLESVSNHVGNDAIKQVENQIKGCIHSKRSLDLFLTLPFVADIDQKIEETSQEMKSIEQAEKILKAGCLSQIQIPSLKTDELSLLLEKSLDSISEEAEMHVKNHCLSYGGKAENWVKQGVEYLNNVSLTTCPFCQQKVDQLDIVHHYRSYFNKAYANLKQEISSYYDIFESDFPNDKLLIIQSVLNTNTSLEKYWKDYFSFELISLSIDQLVTTRNKVFSLVKEILNQKSEEPLNGIRFGGELSLAISNYQEIKMQYDTYNSQVEMINNRITEKKSITETGNSGEINSRKSILEDTRIRYSGEVNELCGSYISKKAEQISLKLKKQEKSGQLKAYSESVLDTYRTTINDYLVKFGTDFEIVDPKTSLQGGKPSATYMLKINNVTVPLGTTETVGEPCFRTILSDGDKNSLAFSFFMAQLKLDTDIANKTIIIDDPITSLDIHRKNRTYQEIKEISKSAKQAIILSHDANFLKLFWENLSTVKTLQICRDGDHSVISEWDIINDTLPSYLQDYYRLENYVTKGDDDLRGVARCIRPFWKDILGSDFQSVLVTASG
jgi:hypothetical protein